MNKKIFILFAMAIVLSSSLVYATDVSSMIGTTDIKTTFISQYPYPAEPGQYMNLLFKIENNGTKNAENVVVKFLQSYPFSLDPNESATKDLGDIMTLSGKNAILVKYKVKIDANAVETINQAKVEIKNSQGSYIQSFDIEVIDPTTDFDIVVQELDPISIAIANVGTNPAYSTVISIPEQKYYKVTGVYESIIGNLDINDYTLASFDITSTQFDTKNNLTVGITYTDIIGARRYAEKQVSLQFDSQVTQISETAIRNTTGTLGNTLPILIVVIAIISFGAGIYLHRHHTKKREKDGVGVEIKGKILRIFKHKEE